MENYASTIRLALIYMGWLLFALKKNPYWRVAIMKLLNKVLFLPLFQMHFKLVCISSNMCNLGAPIFNHINYLQIVDGATIHTTCKSNYENIEVSLSIFQVLLI